jgi:acyl carrier protein
MNAQPSPTPIADHVTRIIVESLGDTANRVTPSAHFVDDLGADSLDRIDVTMAIEEEFDLEIPDDEAEKLLTVGDVIAYVERRVRERA